MTQEAFRVSKSQMLKTIEISQHSQGTPAFPMSSGVKFNEGRLACGVLSLSPTLPLPLSFPLFPLSFPWSFPFPLPLLLRGGPTFFSLGLFFLFLNQRENLSFADDAFWPPIANAVGSKDLGGQKEWNHRCQNVSSMKELATHLLQWVLLCNALQWVAILVDLSVIMFAADAAVP